MPDEPNYVKEAFMSPLNLVFLITALVLALVTGGAVANTLLLFALAAELIYLGTLPRSERYRRVIRSRHAAERSKAPSDTEIFRTLSRDDQKRYVRFRNKEKEIKDNYARLPSASQGLLDAHLAKLDGLLDSYLNLLQLKERHLQFARRAGEAEIVDAIATLKREIAADPPRVAAVKQRRLGILEKRLDRYKKANENLGVIEAQLETIEDVTRYVYEQSLTMQNPEEVSFQLDTLLAEVGETETHVEALGVALADPYSSLTDSDFAEFDREYEARQDPSGLGLDALPDPEAPSTEAPRSRERS